MAQKVPVVEDKLRAVAPLLFKRNFGAMIDIPPDRLPISQTGWRRAPRTKRAAAARTFESGQGDPSARSTFEQKFGAWPPKETVPLRYYLSDGP